MCLLAVIHVFMITGYTWYIDCLIHNDAITCIMMKKLCFAFLEQQYGYWCCHFDHADMWKTFTDLLIENHVITSVQVKVKSFRPALQAFFTDLFSVV